MAGVIIAFDLASQTGVAVGEPGAIPLLMTEILGKRGASHDARFAACMTLVDRLIKLHRPSEVNIEKPIQGRKIRGQDHENDRVPFVLIGLRACVRGVCHLHGVPVSDHAISTIRAHFIGHGRLKGEIAKPRVQQRCKQLGWSFDSPDAADAAALWDYACARRSRSHSIATQKDGLFTTIRA